MHVKYIGRRNGSLAVPGWMGGGGGGHKEVPPLSRSIGIFLDISF